MSDSDRVSLGKAKCWSETKMAVKVGIEGESDKRWIPKSQLHDDSEVYQLGDVGDLVVTMWWAERNGFA